MKLSEFLESAKEHASSGAPYLDLRMSWQNALRRGVEASAVATIGGEGTALGRIIKVKHGDFVVFRFRTQDVIQWAESELKGA